MTRPIRPPQFTVSKNNPCGLDGIEFVEFVSAQPEALDALFKGFGLSKTMRHATKPVDLYQQGDITFLVNREPRSFAAQFGQVHGPSICSMGWRVKDAKRALAEATSRGAKARPEGDFLRDGKPVPAIFGIGDSLIYFVDRYETAPWESLGFVRLETPEVVPARGFFAIDHLTNNVERGTMQAWATFYKSVFGFEEVRYFDIRGARTGLTSYALRSPCGRFCIPINEADEKKSQINEYLEEYKGPGIQHLAFLTDDILASLQKLEGTPVEMLDMDDDYYRDVFQKFPQVTEDKAEIQRRNVLVDGDEQGYLLQIFTKNLVGPIFIEIIQRKNHFSFGEGNFGALFRSIERDQQKRGVFDRE
ncbi:MAG: 4-hydroxyphenylpyruvate dioxygenase [Myxococcaceae bacterium]|nr:4-hydroxyphenylpyruvate dioxygenase [Myxococcaceae bacterium]